MYAVAEHYRNGIGVAKDERKMFEWDKKAAEKGQIYSMNWLGIYYMEGIAGVVNKDIRQALNWWQKAAEKGSIPAMNNINMYFLQKMSSV